MREMLQIYPGVNNIAHVLRNKIGGEQLVLKHVFEQYPECNP